MQSDAVELFPLSSSRLHLQVQQSVCSRMTSIRIIITLIRGYFAFSHSLESDDYEENSVYEKGLRRTHLR